MRFAEFKLLFEEKQKMYAIGDSHAKAIGSQPGWIDLATNGRSALSAENDAAVNKVTNGSIVVLSAGANDMLNPNKSQVVGRVESLINKLKQKKCTVYYVLFAETDNPKFAKDRNQLRQMVDAAIGSEVGVLDMGKLHYDAKVKGQDGIHAPMGWYAGAARKAASGAKDYTPEKDADQGTKPETEGDIPVIDVPTGRSGTAVADVQKALVALGYSLPRHGVDGIRGPETSAAVSKFQEDNSLAVDGDPGPQTVGVLNKKIAEKGIKFKKSTSSEVKGGYGDLDDEEVKNYGDIPQDKMSEKARSAAEEYLGRSMSDKEWDYLLRATSAESAFNVKSYAMVMGSILNRARDYGKNGVVSALLAKNQFQAVTGTAADGHKPSPHFVRGPNVKQLRAMSVAAIEYLPKVSHSQRDFTATNPAAYGPGTNIGYLHAMRKKGGSEIAGSHFNTTMVA